MDTYRVPPSLVGVYHLLRGDTVVYVGQSRNVLSRVATWRTCGVIEFDAYRVIPCALDELNDLEREHIARYTPEHNRAGVDRAYLPYIRYAWERAARTDAQAADIVDGEGVWPGTAICYSTGVANSVRELIEMANRGVFPKPIGQRMNGKFVYWNRADVAAWLRNGRRVAEQHIEAA